MNTLNKLALGGIAAAAGAGAIAAYVYALRPWHLRWGVTDEEMNAALPGDTIIPDAEISVTHAITVNAPVTEVWKWLVQIGQDRGGFYSYSWLENLFGLRVQNTDEIVPEWQELRVGDFVRSAHEEWLGGQYKDIAGWFVAELESNRSLVLRDEIDHGSWSFVLKPIAENQTRLLIRARGKEPANLIQKLLHYGFFEPAHFLMERKMLLTLKERAEGIPAARIEDPMPQVMPSAEH